MGMESLIMLAGLVSLNLLIAAVLESRIVKEKKASEKELQKAFSALSEKYDAMLGSLVDVLKSTRTDINALKADSDREIEDLAKRLSTVTKQLNAVSGSVLEMELLSDKSTQTAKKPAAPKAKKPATKKTKK